ncbi:cysteine-rich motor neuron 1 protein-like isoform X2 [Dreissena polymorpha]|uniref:cysteine-rich motor neuron 1 protein-like isoform X2 n=1 Tax=Dreissena polymorpha TaxID=45954 RepID=UPI002263E1B9|nr:cysteine-rich motor neuron 1 protein-like isoform X2 [Dreissena polymorpha]
MSAARAKCGNAMAPMFLKQTQGYGLNVISPDCDASECDSIVTHHCPSDSVLVYNSTQEDDACCKITYECRCNMASCKIPKCFPGHTPQILRHSNHRPGSCCDLYQCTMRGCLSEGQVYKNSETWREGDCVMCQCVNGSKQCQAEMCVTTCHSPRYVPGRCCPICEAPSVYPDQSSSQCPSLAGCKVSCQTGLRKTPDGCRVCKCKPSTCVTDCPYGYMYDELGQEVCECNIPPDHCPTLNNCPKHCSHGYRISKGGCPKCRCNKCPVLTCEKGCHLGYHTDRLGCQVCECQDILWEKNCTVNMSEFHPGQSWTTADCRMCVCQTDGSVACHAINCPVQHCLVLVNKPGECCPVCLNMSLIPKDGALKIDVTETSTVGVMVRKSELVELERKYVVSLAVVGSMLIVLLLLVFLLLYCKLKHRASWSLAHTHEPFCRCPTFMGQSSMQHTYTIKPDLPDKLAYGPILVQKYQPHFLEASPKSDSDERKIFIDKENEDDTLKDLLNETNQTEIESNCKFKVWQSA